MLTSPAAINTMDPALLAGSAPKEFILIPPFAQNNQLCTSHNATVIDASTRHSDREQLQAMLQHEDLETMHKWLWYAGRKGNISPLHHQKVIRREIILTERAQLHLVWFGRTIYIQRLSDSLLDWTYFSEVVCQDARIYQAATGFLLSYALPLVHHHLILSPTASTDNHPKRSTKNMRPQLLLASLATTLSLSSAQPFPAHAHAHLAAPTTTTTTTVILPTPSPRSAA